ncbi:MAG: TonB-dependent receptor domain-containing protein [Brevundimonas sp.]|uniref:TonB-dependent receptor domain-containing protein n=1 Tax=Brevundimonas sp. TaxID=1871086 RepID=UPI0039199747
MNIQNTRERLLASTMIGGAALLALAATPAMAQDQEATRVEEVVITGTRIAQANLVTTSPVTQVTGEEITNAGVSRVEDLVNQLPQIFAGQTSTTVNGSSGTATVDLRGLGPARTVVLVDGRRMPYGSPAIAAADLNQIPAAMVERVEVYTGGASAVYGADAVAGVVNFIMRKNFEGVRVDAQYGFYQHNNDYDGVGNVRAEIARRGTSNPAEFRLPEDNVRDGETTQFSLVVGTDVGGGRGNITSYFTYRENNPVFQADRDYSACAIGAPNAATGPNTYSCGGSATSAGGYFTDFDTFGFTLNPNNPAGEFIPYDPNVHAYNYAPINYYMRPETRYSFGVFANYELNRAAEVYTQLMFTDSSTLAQIAPSGSFFNNETINCGNPLLSAQQSAAIGCTPADIAADNDTLLYIGRRNVEGGPRVQDYNLNSYRLVGGLRGDITDAWSYDLTAQYARVQYTDRYIGDFSSQRLGRALDVVSVGGVPTCRSVVDGTDPNCVPYNPFRPGGITAEQIEYLSLPLIATGYVTNQVLTAAMTGDLSAYGVQSPWASSGMQVAFGTEYRRDFLTVNTDSGYQSGDGTGQGGAFIGITGATTARDYFAELILPIAEGLPFADSITLDAAYRHSQYNLAEDTDTYQVGLGWAPTRDIRFRASYARAVRAPNVFNYFNAQNVVLFGRGGGDPCGAAATATLAQCVATGVPASNYGTANIDSPANQYNNLTGGNPDLNAEEADTYTYGLVFTPSFLPGFNLSIDYFDIEISGAIGTFGANNTIDACYGIGAFAGAGSDAAACARLNRAPGGQLWTNNGFVENLTINTGGERTTGIDVVANYNMNLDDYGLAGMGGLSFNLTGTWLESLENTPFDGAPALECVGYYENNCGFGSPEWRHRFTTSWATPWDVNLLLTWRYHGEVEHFGLTGAGLDRLDRYFDAYNWFDIGATWQAFDNTRVRVGINNVFDKDPPLSYSGGGNGNTYPGVYDSMGRYIFFGITADF